MSLNKLQKLQLVAGLENTVVEITYRSKSGKVDTFSVTRNFDLGGHLVEPIVGFSYYDRISVYSFKHEHVITILTDSVENFSHEPFHIKKTPKDDYEDAEIGYYAICERLNVTSGRVCDTEEEALNYLADELKVSHYKNIEAGYIGRYNVEVIQLRKIHHSMIELVADTKTAHFERYE